MSETDPALEHLRSLPPFQVDPDLREWDAPGGVRGSKAGLVASFRALGMRAVVDQDETGALRFAAWRNPRASGAVLAGILGGLLYLVLSRAGVTHWGIFAAVAVAAFYVPLAVLPSFRVAGTIENGRVQVRITARGLLGFRGALERRLRFYLERS